MRTVQELTEAITGITTQLQRARTEILNRIARLEEIIGQTTLPPEVGQQLEQLRAIAQALDDVNPDEPAPEV